MHHDDPNPGWPERAKTLGLAVQRRRLVLGLSQEQLAHQIGVTRTYMQQLERGVGTGGRPTNPSLRVVLALCDELQASIDDLVTDKPL